MHTALLTTERAANKTENKSIVLTCVDVRCIEMYE
jgi:hypothetical protein